MNKKKLGVIFGSRSCEREVAIISAVQLMRHADRDKYDVVPVYLDEHGNWYTGEPLFDIGSYQPFRPETKGVTQVFLDMTYGSGALLRMEKGSGLFARNELKMVERIDVFIIVMHGMNGEDGTLQGMLELAGIPLLSSERGEGDPVICAGGNCSCNPEPLADFIDFYMIGDGEDVLVETAELMKERKRKGWSRRELLERLCLLEGVYVPSLYEPEYDGEGRMTGHR